MTPVIVDVCSAKAAEGALQCTGVREVVFVERVSCAWRVCGWSPRQMHSSLTLALLVHHLPTTLSRMPSKSDVMSRLCRVLISRCGFQATFLITAGKFVFRPLLTSSAMPQGSHTNACMQASACDTAWSGQGIRILMVDGAPCPAQALSWCPS